MVKDYDAETLFPWWLHEEVISILKKRGCRFSTYSRTRTIPISTSYGFLMEFARYKLGDDAGAFRVHLFSLGEAVRRASKKVWRQAPQRRSISEAIVFLQHDADRQPYKTVEMMDREAKAGVVSSNYFFFERHIWDDDREPYLLDLPALQRLEEAGFEIGYHLNGFELAGYDLRKAQDIVSRDIRFFASRFNLRTVVPHGGVRGPGGLNNNRFPTGGVLKPYTIAYNGIKRGYLTDVTWSDGVLSASLPDPRVVASNVERGQRVRFLMHPQYYGHSQMRDCSGYPVTQQAWWKSLWPSRAS
jgi:hypothetical protein